MKRLPRLYFLGRTANCGGYKTVADNYISAFESAGIDYTLFSTDLLRVKSNYPLLSINSSEPTVALMWETPEFTPFIKREGSSLKLLYGTIFETETLPRQWLSPLLAADEVWVPTEFNAHGFAQGGVPSGKLRKIPLCLDTRPYDSSIAPMEIEGRKRFAFLYAFVCPSRKDPALLLRAFFKAFTAKDDVCLVLKIIPGHIDLEKVFASLLPEFDVKRDDSLPKVIAIEEAFSLERMIALYKACDVYATSERAKGWDYPAMEMMSLGKPCVSIDWSGSTEFMNSGNAFLVPHTGGFADIGRGDVSDAVLPLMRGQRWPIVDADVFAKVMREAYEDVPKQKRLGEAARDCVRSKYSHVAIGRLISETLESYVFAPRAGKATLTVAPPAQKKVFTSKDKAMALLEQFVLGRLASFAQKYSRIAIFPFGAHTQWLLLLMGKAKSKGIKTPEIVCMFDDNATAKQISLPWRTPIPILRPAECDPSSIDAVLISSDMAEADLAAKLRKSARHEKPILELYGEIQEMGPFEKKALSPDECTTAGGVKNSA